MDLGDCSVDSPAGAHLAPMQDELLFDWFKVVAHKFLTFLSIQNLHNNPPLSSFGPKLNLFPAPNSEKPRSSLCPDGDLRQACRNKAESTSLQIHRSRA